jgi:hypothetical protein
LLVDDGWNDGCDGWALTGKATNEAIKLSMSNFIGRSPSTVLG